MVGTCAALELRLRGYEVTLLDRRAPGQEASYGNAGLIQREAVEPYSMPRDWRSLLTIALNTGPHVHYHLQGLLSAAPQLLAYWKASAPARHLAISHDYQKLIAACIREHQRFIELASAGDLVRRDGLRVVYRTGGALDKARRSARRVSTIYGVRFNELDSHALAIAEPSFTSDLAGAVHWLDTWNVTDPGALVARYAALYQQLGGQVVLGDATTLRPIPLGWQVRSSKGFLQAEHVVLALGAEMRPLTRRLGYSWPLFEKRGYHRHFEQGAKVNVPTLDEERGYVIAPVAQGLRITTGAEIAKLGAPSTPRQLLSAEKSARSMLYLGTAVESEPWVGNRPCCADMKPVIGMAPAHRGLWVNCGHGHQGFTLGPASARLLADLIDGSTPFVPAEAFSPQRFSA